MFFSSPQLNQTSEHPSGSEQRRTAGGARVSVFLHADRRCSSLLMCKTRPRFQTGYWPDMNQTEQLGDRQQTRVTDWGPAAPNQEINTQNFCTEMSSCVCKNSQNQVHYEVSGTIWWISMFHVPPPPEGSVEKRSDHLSCLDKNGDFYSENKNMFYYVFWFKLNWKLQGVLFQLLFFIAQQFHKVGASNVSLLSLRIFTFLLCHNKERGSDQSEESSEETGFFFYTTSFSIKKSTS